jgi:hypothetical protein
MDKNIRAPLLADLVHEFVNLFRVLMNQQKESQAQVAQISSNASSRPHGKHLFAAE